MAIGDIGYSKGKVNNVYRVVPLDGRVIIVIHGHTINIGKLSYKSAQIHIYSGGAVDARGKFSGEII